MTEWSLSWEGPGGSLSAGLSLNAPGGVAMSAYADLIPDLQLKGVEAVKVFTETPWQARFLLGRAHRSSGDLLKLVSGSLHAPRQPAVIIEATRPPFDALAQYVWGVPNKGKDGNLLHVQAGFEGSSNGIQVIGLRHDSDWRGRGEHDGPRTMRQSLAAQGFGEWGSLRIEGEAASTSGTPPEESSRPFAASALVVCLSTKAKDMDWKVTAHEVEEGFESLVTRSRPFPSGTRGVSVEGTWKPQGWRIKASAGETWETPGNFYFDWGVDIRKYLNPGKLYARWSSGKLTTWCLGVERGGLKVEQTQSGTKVKGALQINGVKLACSLSLTDTEKLTVKVSWGGLTAKTEVLWEEGEKAPGLQYCLEYSAPLG